MATRATEDVVAGWRTLARVRDLLDIRYRGAPRPAAPAPFDSLDP
jgi:hypothetical protein